MLLICIWLYMGFRDTTVSSHWMQHLGLMLFCTFAKDYVSLIWFSIHVTIKPTLQGEERREWSLSGMRGTLETTEDLIIVKSSYWGGGWDQMVKWLIAVCLSGLSANDAGHW